MRGVLVLLAAAAVTACANDMTSPTVQPQPSNSIAAANDSSGGWRFGRHGAMGMFMTRRLPANLQLTETQRAQIRTLMASFHGANQQDLTAVRTSMRAAMRQARAARTAGKRLSIDQRRALFEQSRPAQQRLMTARRQLASQIQNVLTADQRAWLAAHRPAPCAGACRARFARRGPQTRNPS